jgi:general secretion pathway protein A
MEKTNPVNLRATFGFTATPFTREIRAEDQFGLPFLDEALGGVLRAVEGRNSAAVIAPAGSGKTCFLRRVRSGLPEARYRVHYVKCTDLSRRDMCREIASTCGLPSTGTFPSLLRQIQTRYETTLGTEGLRPVLLLDECHDLRPEVLAMLSLLTNFEMDSRLVLAVVLAGQPRLATMLRQDAQESIARRIVHYAQLRLLSRDEVERYVAHRCTVAGAKKLPFDERGLDALFEIGRGNLRATDTLALKALEYAALGKHSTVSAQHLMAARKDLWP